MALTTAQDPRKEMVKRARKYPGYADARFGFANGRLWMRNPEDYTDRGYALFAEQIGEGPGRWSHKGDPLIVKKPA